MWPTLSFHSYVHSSGHLFPHVIVLQYFPGFRNLQRFKEVSLHSANLLGRHGRLRRGTGGTPALRLSCCAATQVYTVPAASPGAHKLYWLLLEHKELLSLHTPSFNEQQLPLIHESWAVASSHRYSVFVGCLAGPRFRLVLRQHCSKL